MIPARLAAQSLLTPQGGLLRPAGDASLANVVIGSGVTLAGQLRYTKDVYVIQTSTAGAVQYTAFDNTAGNPGATEVAIAPNGGTVAYMAILVRSGQRSEEVHTIDIGSRADHLIATDTEGCVQPTCVNCFASCLHGLHFSADSKKLIWVSSQTKPLFVADLAGGSVLRLNVPAGDLANSPNVVTSDGRLVFLNGNTAFSIQLDGSALTQLPYGPVTSDFVVSADGRTAAWQTLGQVNAGQSLYSVQRASGSVDTVKLDSSPFASLAISTDGSRVAFVHQRQAWTPSQVTNFVYSDVVDVALDSTGSKLLYSTGELNSLDRSAVWLANSNGTGAKAIFAPASINPGGIIGINSQGLPVPLSPGTYFTVYGRNLHLTDELVTSNIPVSITSPLGSAPLQALTPWQVNAFLPMTTPAGNVSFTLGLETGKQLNFNATVSQTAPALITFPDASGQQQAAAFHLTTLIPCDPQHAAHANETVETYGFGLGLTDLVQQPGVPAPSNPPARTVVTPTVLIGSQKAQILFSGLVPTVIGVYQINIVTPALPPGDYPMQWSTDGQTPVSKGNFSIR